MNNQLITPTEYEAKSPKEKENYILKCKIKCTDCWDAAIYPIESYDLNGVLEFMYAPIIPIKEELTVTRFTMSEDLILKKNDVVAAVFCDSKLATEVINYLNRK